MFEEILISLKDLQLALDESKSKVENQMARIQNRMPLVRKARKLQDKIFTSEKILGIFPEVKGVLSPLL